jgi:hypothetical protein
VWGIEKCTSQDRFSYAVTIDTPELVVVYNNKHLFHVLTKYLSWFDREISFSAAPGSQSSKWSLSNIAGTPSGENRVLETLLRTHIIPAHLSLARNNCRIPSTIKGERRKTLPGVEKKWKYLGKTSLITTKWVWE